MFKKASGSRFRIDEFCVCVHRLPLLVVEVENQIEF